MRRSDREINDKKTIYEIIETAEVCRLGFCAENRPYIVPMNFGYEVINDKLTLYFHCACKGRKLDMLKINNFVCFEIDLAFGVENGGKACSYTMKYKSVIGEGRIFVCDNDAEKEKGLNLILTHYVKDTSFTFKNEEISAVTVLKLVVENISAKSNMKRE